MSGELPRPEPWSVNSQKSDSAGSPDAPAETVVPGDSRPSNPDADETVLRREQSLLSTSGATQPAGEQSSPAAAVPGVRFRIIRPHARGGLGEVFVARDEELNRDVALKEIHARHADNRDSRGRFLLEAEITGGLEHPGIVPVYGLGQYPDGRPYYAMRFIQGDSLKEAISAYHSRQNADANDPERTLQLRRLLGRFVDVCQAVSYAHSRGVLHRDLKPGNIMLGKYGETLVVDWGLARLHGRDDVPDGVAHQLLKPASSDGVTPTVMGRALGTPAYMPPEQAAGRLDQLGPQSDVYSLGATLYHVLTGRAPFQADSLENTLKAVQLGTFPRPREVNAAVPRPLEAVCLKAMALQPRDRYPSPQDLADDIERYLADEPVQAFPEPLPVRARRWVRKHPTLTTTTAVVVLLSLAGLGTFSSILGAKNRELGTLNQNLDQRNRELDQANSDLTAANRREVEARELAQDNEQTAREQSQLALSTLAKVIFDVQRGLQDVPGGSEVRRRLLATSLEKLEEVAGEYVAQAAVDRNTMIALFDMGEVILQFGAGNDVDVVPSTDRERSSVPLARQFYKRAHDIAAELAAAHPENREAQFDLAFSFHTLGDVHFMRLRETRSALEHFRQSRAIYERLAEDDPNDAKVQRDLSVLYYKLGDVHLQLEGTLPALEFYRKSNDILERLSRLDPDDANVQLQLSVSYNRLGDMHMQVMDMASARVSYQQSLDVRERLAAADPANALAQRNLSVSYNNLGDVHQALGEFESAREYYRKYNEICERLAADDPNDGRTQRDLAVSYENLGEVNLRLQDAPSARDFFQQYFSIATRLAEADPTDARAQRDLSVACERLGIVHQRLGEAHSALGFLEQSRDIRGRLAMADPMNSESQRDLAVAYCGLGDLHRRQEDLETARKNYEAYLEICERVAKADPASVQAQRDLLDAQQRLGNLSVQVGNKQDALERRRQANAILKPLAARDPGNARTQRELMISHYELAKALAALQEYDASLTEYSAAISILDEMIVKGRSIDESRRDRETVLKERNAVEVEAAQAHKQE